MTHRKLSAGDTIEARCTRCRTALNHTIVAMIEEKVVRVQCNTCHGIHNYHEPAQPKSQAKPGRQEPANRQKTVSSRKPKIDPEEVALQEWETVRPDIEKGTAVRYDINANYRPKTVIEHPVFGLGLVRQIMPHKVEVVFRSGTKLLRCG